MIASNHNRSLDNTSGHEIVESQRRLVAFAITQPTDTCRQALKLDLFASHWNPALQACIIWEEIKHYLIGTIDILRIAGERYPAEWSFSATEQWTNVCRHKAWIIKGMGLS